MKLNAMILIALIAPAANAITSSQFAEPKRQKLCYVQQDSAGAVTSLVVLNFERPMLDAFGNYTRTFSGYEQLKPSEKVSAIYGSGTYFPAENTQPGIPDIRLDMSRRFEGSAIDRDMRYFSDGARAEYWTQIQCQASTQRSAASMSVSSDHFSPVTPRQ